MTLASNHVRAGLLLAVAVVAIALFALPLNGSASTDGQQAVQSQQGDRTCELYARWSMCAWPGPSGMPIGHAFSANESGDGDISSRITVVYTWIAPEQRWAAYFPQFADVPGANDFETFTASTAYWIGITDGPNLTWTPPSDLPDETPTPTPEPELGSLTVHYIDVGQADATLIAAANCVILVDAGHWQRNDVVPYLESVDIDEIDLLIGTHPHADHIGQFPQVLSTFTVTEVWMSGYEPTSQTYQNAMDAISASGAIYHEPRTSETRDCGDGELTVLNPPGESNDIHEMSISVRFVWGDVAFMFTGDAEAQTEQWMVNSGQTLQAQIYQAGHHGSNTSSTQVFLDAMNPEVAIYSAGENNQYGHPHTEVLQRFAAMGIEVYGTDTHGIVIVTTDGTTYEIETQTGTGPQPPPGTPLPATPTPTTAPATATPPAACVNINTATHEELQAIVHIGPDRATEIINLRPFTSVDELINVSGIGPARLQDIKDQGLACV